jgi:hypothetical protein
MVIVSSKIILIIIEHQLCIEQIKLTLFDRNSIILLRLRLAYAGTAACTQPKRATVYDMSILFYKLSIVFVMHTYCLCVVTHTYPKICWVLLAFSVLKGLQQPGLGIIVNRARPPFLHLCKFAWSYIARGRIHIVISNLLPSKPGRAVSKFPLHAPARRSSAALGLRPCPVFSLTHPAKGIVIG